MPSLAAYHDLRWLFTDSQSWLWFAGLVAAVLIVRSALDVALLRLAWPGGLPAPRLGRSFASCAALTALAWLLLTPAATLAFGVAVLPFSWPFLAAFPIMLGIVVALSHGGTVQAWWRRLPPLRAVAWLLGSFVALTAAGAVIAHLPTWEALPVIAVAGLVNARAWYGLALIAAQLRPRAARVGAGQAGVQPAVRADRGGAGGRPGGGGGPADVHRDDRAAGQRHRRPSAAAAAVPAVAATAPARRCRRWPTAPRRPPA